MTNIAVIDLDGVVANSDARFALARGGSDGHKGAEGSVDWGIAFDPANVALDTLIKGADLAVKHLEKREYDVVFLTSRPETMRQATEMWLASHGGIGGRELIMKPSSQQRTKTVSWKASVVREIASYYGVHDMIFADDEEANRIAVQGLELGIVCKASLDDYIPDDGPIII